jgi:hypothetical protein
MGVGERVRQVEEWVGVSVQCLLCGHDEEGENQDVLEGAECGNETEDEEVTKYVCPRGGSNP